MGRTAGIFLSRAQQRQLGELMSKTRDKREYRSAEGLLLRAEGKSVEYIARRLNVTMKQVFVWTRKFRESGVTGLQVKKQTGRPTKKADAAKPKIKQILARDPQAFGYLKGRWVLRDIARELAKEGVAIHWTSVRRILGDLDIVLKAPRLRAQGSLKKNYGKRKEIQNYKRIAPALLKKRFSSDSKMKNGLNSSQKSNGVGQKEDRSLTFQRSDTTKG